MVARSLSLLVVAALFAGCLGGNSNSSKVDDAPDVALGPARIPLPDVISFAAPVVLGTMTGGAEPSIAVAPDGTVYVTTPLSMWRSDDGGKTYKALGRPTCPLAQLPLCPGLEENDPGAKGGGDADIHVGPDGRVHWLGLVDGDNAIPYQVSSDKGETWSEVVDLAGDDRADREWITGRVDGTLFAAWRNFPPADADRNATIVVRASYDGGTTWTNASDVAPDTRQGGVSVDPSSDALALVHDRAGNVSVAHSFDNGTTWESVVVVDDLFLGHIFPVTTFDNNGTLYAAFAHDRDGIGNPQTTNRPLETPSLYLSVSHDKGLTWSPLVQVNEPGTTAWFPWITAGEAGRVILVWYQNDRGLPRQLADEVYVMAGMSMDADAPNPEFRNVRVSPTPIHRGPECRENPGVCTRSLLDFFEVAIHPDGYPVVTWAQDTWPAPRVSVAASYMTEGPDFLH